MLGKLLQGRYKVLQVLSAGGFCSTYLAQDTEQPSSPTYVVKHFQSASDHPESLPTLRRLFTREVEALQKLGDYDQVPQLVAHFEEHQEFFLVQEFIEGRPLSAQLQLGQPWSEQQAVQLLQEVLSILEVIHSHGLIHRNLKPSNLIRRQQDDRLVLVGFGSVKQAWTQVVTTQGQTSASFSVGIPTRISIGTPGYMPTEQERGRPRPNSDIYALGMIAIQAVTGLHPAQLPEDIKSGEIMWQYQANVSPHLTDLLSKMVRYHFQDRYQTATEVMQALQPLIKRDSPPAQLALPKQLSTQAEAQEASEIAPEGATPSAPTGITQTQIPASWPNKVPLLLGIGIGIGSAVGLVVGLYYFLRPPASSPKFQQDPTSLSRQNLTVGDIVLANTLTGHSDVVWSIALNSDHQTLVSGSGDKTIKLWNLGNGKLLRTFSGNLNPVISVAVSRDGQSLVSGSYATQEAIKVWNLSTGELRRTLFRGSNQVWSIALSPDGQTLVSSSGDRIIRLWNLRTGELQRSLSGHSDTVWSVAISPDGQTLASGSTDKTIKLWNLRTGQLYRTLTGHTGRVRSVAISSDGQFLASGSWDKTIKLWNLRTGRLLRTLNGHSAYVNTVAISPNGQILASGSDDFSIKIWNLNTGELMRTLYGHSGNLNSVKFDTEGKILVSASGDKTIKIWRLELGD